MLRYILPLVVVLAGCSGHTYSKSPVMPADTVFTQCPADMGLKAEWVTMSVETNTGAPRPTAYRICTFRR